MAEHIEQQRFAVLIDGDNAQASLLAQILAEVSKSGLITIKRIYGDWTTTSMNSWKTALHTHAVQPIQQFRYTVGKNATDSAMIIDAMDLLHSNDVDGFCIVSSDSDYTRLATRIREDGLFVIGVGEKKTPEAFTNACNQFIYCENLTATKEPRKQSSKKTKKEEKQDEHYYCCESYTGSFQRSLWLPVNVQNDNIKTSFKNGILAISLQKKQEAEKKEVEVKVE